MSKEDPLSEEDRLALMHIWNGLVVFAAVCYLTGNFIKALIVGGFFLISGVLGFGSRWLLRLGFAVAMLAIAVFLGFPHPDQWPNLLKAAPKALQDARDGIAGPLH